MKNRAKFERIFILADPVKVEQFGKMKSQGVELVVGSFLDASSYECFEVVVFLVGNVPSSTPRSPGVRVTSTVRRQSDLCGRRQETLFPRQGGFTEVVASSQLSGMDPKSHACRPYGMPDAPVTLTAIPKIMKFIVESVLLPLPAGQPCRELRISGDTLTWTALMDLLGEVQGLKYEMTYLDPQEATGKEEAARVARNVEGKLFWFLKAMFPNGVAFVPGLYDNSRFSFVPETAR
ncbi:hypothetical protein FB451DRAFT_1398116 [Mycena latifolia]|nr:hypothetical protein FB451DRAFT_1398116 [Mycena latifolia]